MESFFCVIDEISQLTNQRIFLEIDRISRSKYLRHLESRDCPKDGNSHVHTLHTNIYKINISPQMSVHRALKNFFNALFISMPLGAALKGLIASKSVPNGLEP